MEDKKDAPLSALDFEEKQEARLSEFDEALEEIAGAAEKTLHDDAVTPMEKLAAADDAFLKSLRYLQNTVRPFFVHHATAYGPGIWDRYDEWEEGIYDRFNAFVKDDFPREKEYWLSEIQKNIDAIAVCRPLAVSVLEKLPAGGEMRRSSLFHAFGGSDDVKTAVKCMTEAGFLEEYKKGGAFCLRRADGAAEDTIDAALKKLLEDHRRVQAVLAAMDPAPKIRPAKSAPAPLPALAASAEGEAENTGESVHAQKKKGLSCTSIILCILLILAACFLFSLWSGLLFLALLFFVFQK